MDLPTGNGAISNDNALKVQQETMIVKLQTRFGDFETEGEAEKDDYSVQEFDELMREWTVLNKKLNGFGIDCKSLRSLCQQMGRLAEMPHPLRSASDKAQMAATWQKLTRKLDKEIDKAAHYYTDQLTLVVAGMGSLRSRWPYLTPETFEDMYKKTKMITLDLQDAFDFMDLQLSILNTLLQFFEQWMGDEELMSKEEFVQHRLAPDCNTSLLRKLHISTDTRHLIEELVEALSHLRKIEKQWIDEGAMTKAECRKLHRADTYDIIKGIQSKTVEKLKKQEWYYQLGARAMVDYDHKPVGESTSFGLFISNFNTFLYMANYYSAIPAANLYAKELGLSETLSGLLLSMTPFAAVISTYFYSQMSNTSFSVPTKLSTVFLVIGNYLYATAIINKSILRLFFGRLLVGAGGNRAANRRYIADFVAIESRSTQSIVFVAVSGLGMACGPFVQSCMQYLPSGPHGKDLEIYGYPLTMITGPPWFFFVAWLAFYAMVELFFEEPVRNYAVNQTNIFEPLLQKQLSMEAGFGHGPEMRAARVNTQDYYSQFMELFGSIICLWIYFALKMVQEAVQTAAPLVTESAFKWTEKDASNLLTMIGLVALPTNFVVTFLAQIMDPRTLQMASMLGILIGSAIAIDSSTVGFTFTPTQYVAGATCLFICAQVLEGINMGLLSTVMPKKYSKGLFNTGFLSTEAGTIGRVAGAMTITVAGSLVPKEHVNNLVMISCVGVIGFTMILAFYARGHLERKTVAGANIHEDFAEDLKGMHMSIGPMPFTYRSLSILGGMPSMASMNADTLNFSKKLSIGRNTSNAIPTPKNPPKHLQTPMPPTQQKKGSFAKNAPPLNRHDECSNESATEESFEGGPSLSPRQKPPVEGVAFNAARTVL